MQTSFSTSNVQSHLRQFMGTLTISESIIADVLGNGAISGLMSRSKAARTRRRRLLTSFKSDRPHRRSSQMKVVLFCGGLGTRLREDLSSGLPKPLVNIGYRPILWHIMK